MDPICNAVGIGDRVVIIIFDEVVCSGLLVTSMLDGSGPKDDLSRGSPPKVRDEEVPQTDPSPGLTASVVI